MSVDLTTNYGGLPLASPIVVGACPLMADDQQRQAAEQAGAGALVLPSLFDEFVANWSDIGQGVAGNDAPLEPRAPLPDPVWHDPDAYLALVNRASAQASIPVIASLNGYKARQWIDFAGELQEAGAGAIELNLEHGRASESSDPREIESLVVDAVREVSEAVTIPLFVKLSHPYTSVPHLARQLQSGAQGLVLFGRRPSVDIDLEDLSLSTHWGLTTPGSITESIEMIMQVHACCPAMPIAAGGGIGTSDDVFKALLAGADVALVTSMVYRQGAAMIRSLVQGLELHLQQHQLDSLRDLQMNRPLQFDSEVERARYIRALSARLDELHALAEKGLQRPQP